MPDANQYEKERRKKEARKFNEFFVEFKELLMKYADTPAEAIGYLEAFKLRLLTSAIENLKKAGKE